MKQLSEIEILKYCSLKEKLISKNALSSLSKDFEKEYSEKILEACFRKDVFMIDVSTISECILEIQNEDLKQPLEKNSKYDDPEGNLVSRIITKKARYAICSRQKWRCNSCFSVLKFSKNSDWDGDVAHVDHIHPYSDRRSYPSGASKINELPNLQALCSKCNLKKGKRKG